MQSREAAVFVDFFGWFKDGSDVFIAMEYVPLGDLENKYHGTFRKDTGERSSKHNRTNTFRTGDYAWTIVCAQRFEAAGKLLPFYQIVFTFKPAFIA